jgi:hypothetical protein
MVTQQVSMINWWGSLPALPEWEYMKCRIRGWVGRSARKLPSVEGGAMVGRWELAKWVGVVGLGLASGVLLVACGGGSGIPRAAQTEVAREATTTTTSTTTTTTTVPPTTTTVPPTTTTVPPTTTTTLPPLTDPTILVAALNQAAEQLLGRGPYSSEDQGFITEYQGKELENEQAAANGMAIVDLDPYSEATAYLEQVDSTEIEGNQAANAYQEFSNALGG